MIDRNPALSFDFFKITIRHSIAHIEKTACRITAFGNCVPLKSIMPKALENHKL